MNSWKDMAGTSEATLGAKISMFEKTLDELTKNHKEVYIAKMKTIAFLKQFRWENLTTEQMLKILEVVKEGK